jgi:DNA end-binding protein Ku
MDRDRAVDRSRRQQGAGLDASAPAGWLRPQIADIVEQKSGHFEPQKFEDHYETALTELLAKKQQGLPIAAAKKPAPDNVVNLMDALRASLASSGKAASAAKPTKAHAAKKAGKKRKAG